MVRLLPTELSSGRLRHPALKGPNEIAQGNALGGATVFVLSPERAKSGSDVCVSHQITAPSWLKAATLCARAARRTLVTPKLD